MMENLKIKIGLAAFTVLAPLLITISGAYISNQLAVARMDERIAVIQKDIARHEVDRGQDIQRLMASRDDHAQRIVRLEASLDAIHVILSELKSDMKTLIARDVRH